MKVKSLKLKNYRNFVEKSFEFRSGLNIISGNNGTGKSTIFYAFSELLLFDFNIYRKNFYSGITPYSIECVIELDDTYVEIFKDAENNEFYIKIESDRFDKDEALEEFEKRFNIDINRNLYKALFFLKQRDWIYFFDKSKNIKTVADIIKNYIATGTMNLDKDISSKIIDRKKKLINQNRDLNDKIEIKKLELDTCRNFVIEKELNYNQRFDVINKIEIIGKEISKQEFIFQAFTDYNSLKEEFVELSEQTETLKDSIDKIEKLEEKKNYLENKIKSYKSFSLDKIEEISRISGVLQNKNKELLSETYDKNVSSYIAYKKICFFIGTIFFLIALFGSLFSIYFSFLFMPAVILFFFGSYFNTRAGEDIKNNQKKVQIEFSRDVQSLNNELNTILKSSGASTVEEYKEKFRAKEDILKNIDSVKKELDILYASRSFENIEDEYNELRERMIVLKNKISSIKDENTYTEMQAELVKNKIDTLYEKKEKNEEKLKNIQALIANNKYTLNDLNILEEHIAEYTMLSEKNKDLLNVLGFVEEFLKRSHMDMMDDANSILDLTIDKYFVYLTAWEYQDVKVEFTGENKLYFNVYCKKLQKYINEDMLSDATLDQLYIAFRFALIELLDESGIMPLLLDDIFSYFDKNRVESSCSLFSNMSINRQIFYFNGNEYINEHYNKIINVNVVNLI